VQIGAKLQLVGCRGTEKKTTWEKKVTNPLHFTTRRGAICNKFGEFVDLTAVVTLAKFGYKTFSDFSSPRGEKSIFRLDANGLYNNATRYRAGL